jgi:alpha-ketoglutarate-dependent taurine dioxygenase
MSIKVTTLTGSVGGLVEGIDLNGPINNAQFAVLRQAFLDECMPVFRGQYPKPQAQIQLDATQPVHPSMLPGAWDEWKSCRDVA